jgi:deoxyribose-phosphate aldolase
MLTRAELAAIIDHTLLRPTATRAQVEALCAEAREHRFASVCVNPSRVAARPRLSARTGPGVCTVIGFPLGANRPDIKAAEARSPCRGRRRARRRHQPRQLLKDGDHAAVVADLQGVVAAAEGRLVKVILEVALLDPAEIDLACRLAVDAGARFVKTSTGFGPRRRHRRGRRPHAPRRRPDTSASRPPAASATPPPPAP